MLVRVNGMSKSASFGGRKLENGGRKCGTGGEILGWWRIRRGENFYFADVWKKTRT